MNIEEFSAITGIPPRELLGRSSTRRLNSARQLLWLRLREEGYTTTEIGKRFGRNHSSVVSGVKTVRNLIETGDLLVRGWNEKIKIMSERKHTIEISPPACFDHNGQTERYSESGFKCPRCNGRGHFMPVEVEKDRYEEVKCSSCLGTGRLRADVLIRWIAESDDGRDE
jgi:hypothetical protein